MLQGLVVSLRLILTKGSGGLRACQARGFLAKEDKLKYSKMNWTFITLALAAMVVVGACKKHEVPPAPPATPPAPAAAPKASLSVSPESIQPGASATLTWATEDATTVTIDGIGTVQPNGSQSVSPTASTTYHLTAQGPGGSADAHGSPRWMPRHLRQRRPPHPNE